MCCVVSAAISSHFKTDQSDTEQTPVQDQNSNVRKVSPKSENQLSEKIITALQ